MDIGIQVKFVMIPVFEKLTGYTDKAVRHKIERGEWRQGVHYRKSPDGRIHIDMQAYYKWVVGSDRLSS